MRKFAFLAIAAVAVTGCTETRYVDRIVKVDVPVFLPPPKPAEVELPRLPIYDLTPKSTPDEVAKAYVATAEILLIHAKQKEASTKPFDGDEVE